MREPSSRFCDFNFCANLKFGTGGLRRKSGSVAAALKKSARLRRRPLQTLAEEFAGDFGNVLSLIAGDLQFIFAGLPRAIRPRQGGRAVWRAS